MRGSSPKVGRSPIAANRWRTCKRRRPHANRQRAFGPEPLSLHGSGERRTEQFAPRRLNFAEVHVSYISDRGLFTQILSFCAHIGMASGPNRHKCDLRQSLAMLAWPISGAVVIVSDMRCTRG